MVPSGRAGCCWHWERFLHVGNAAGKCTLGLSRSTRHPTGCSFGKSPKGDACMYLRLGAQAREGQETGGKIPANLSQAG